MSHFLLPDEPEVAGTRQEAQAAFFGGAQVFSGTTGAQNGTATKELCHFDFPAKASPAAVCMQGWFFMLTQDEDGFGDADAYIEEIKLAVHRKDDGTVVVGNVEEGDWAESSGTGGFPWSFSAAHSTPVAGTSRITLSVTGLSGVGGKQYQGFYKCAWFFTDSAISLSV